MEKFSFLSFDNDSFYCICLYFGAIGLSVAISSRYKYKMPTKLKCKRDLTLLKLSELYTADFLGVTVIILPRLSRIGFKGQ